jgi:hypothetical protein
MSHFVRQNSFLDRRVSQTVVNERFPTLQRRCPWKAPMRSAVIIILSRLASSGRAMESHQQHLLLRAVLQLARASALACSFIHCYGFLFMTSNYWGRGGQMYSSCARLGTSVGIDYSSYRIQCPGTSCIQCVSDFHCFSLSGFSKVVAWW